MLVQAAMQMMGGMGGMGGMGMAPPGYGAGAPGAPAPGAPGGWTQKFRWTKIRWHNFTQLWRLWRDMQNLWILPGMGGGHFDPNMAASFEVPFLSCHGCSRFSRWLQCCRIRWCSRWCRIWHADLRVQLVKPVGYGTWSILIYLVNSCNVVGIDFPVSSGVSIAMSTRQEKTIHLASQMENLSRGMWMEYKLQGWYVLICYIYIYVYLCSLCNINIYIYM